MLLGTLDNVWHTFWINAPVLVLILLVWWFIRTEPENEEAASDEDGGQLVPAAGDRPPHRPGPGGGRPRPPRRGPHGDPAPASPPRVRVAGRRIRVRQTR